MARWHFFGISLHEINYKHYGMFNIVPIDFTQLLKADLVFHNSVINAHFVKGATFIHYAGIWPMCC